MPQFYSGMSIIYPQVLKKKWKVTGQPLIPISNFLQPDIYA